MSRGRPSGAHTAHRQSFEVTIHYPYHPRAGERIQVLRQRRDSGDLYYLIEQPDGTRAQLPAWMTEPRWAKVALVVDPHFKLTTLRTLRKLLDSWLGSQVFATTPGESHEKDACPAVGSFVNNLVNADECTQSGDLRSDGIAPATFADSAPGVTRDAPCGPNKGDLG